MKKSIKSLVVVIVAILLLSMVIWWVSGNNRIIATLDNSMIIGANSENFTQTFEIIFRRGRIESATLIYEFESEEGARVYYVFLSGANIFGEEVARTEKVIVRSFTAERFLEWRTNLGESPTIEEVRRELEEMGYTVR